MQIKKIYKSFNKKIDKFSKNKQIRQNKILIPILIFPIIFVIIITMSTLIFNFLTDTLIFKISSDNILNRVFNAALFFILYMLSFIFIKILRFCYKGFRNNWFLFGIIISIAISWFGYLYLSSLYPDIYPSKYFFTYDREGLNITYNLINLDRLPYALRGNTICFNMSIKNPNSFIVHVRLGGKIEEPTGEIRVVRNESYSIPILNLLPNTTIINKENCEIFTELGLNKFYLYGQIESLNGTLKYIYPNGAYVYVYSESEYSDLINKKNFSFILALATIPTVLFSVKTLRDLHKKD